MTCQALIHRIATPAAACLLAACQVTPEVDHRAISSRARAGLRANSRVPTASEDHGNKIRLEVSITANEPVLLPMSVGDGIPLVPACFNGREAVPVLIDTGSQGCVLEARTALEQRVTILDHAEAIATLGGTTGDERALIGLPDQVAIGTWLLERFPFFVRTHETRVRLSWWERPNIGRDLIGMNAILNSCDFLTFDFPGERIVFGIRGRFTPPPRKKSGVWKVPLIIRDGLPYVKLHTAGGSWTALLDTGFNGHLDMDKATAERLKILDRAKPSSAFRAGLGAPKKDAPTQFGMISLDLMQSLGPRMTNIPMFVVPQRSKIGCALLLPFKVTLDFRRGLLWLEA